MAWPSPNLWADGDWHVDRTYFRLLATFAPHAAPIASIMFFTGEFRLGRFHVKRLFSIVVLAVAPALVFSAPQSTSGTASAVAYRAHPQSTSHHTHRRHANHHSSRHHSGSHHHRV